MGLALAPVDAVPPPTPTDATVAPPLPNPELPPLDPSVGLPLDGVGVAALPAEPELDPDDGRPPPAPLEPLAPPVVGPIDPGEDPPGPVGPTELCLGVLVGATVGVPSG